MSLFIISKKIKYLTQKCLFSLHLNIHGIIVLASTKIMSMIFFPPLVPGSIDNKNILKSQNQEKSVNVSQK